MSDVMSDSRSRLVNRTRALCKVLIVIVEVIKTLGFGFTWLLNSTISGALVYHFLGGEGSGGGVSLNSKSKLQLHNVLYKACVQMDEQRSDELHLLSRLLKYHRLRRRRLMVTIRLILLVCGGTSCDAPL